MHVCCLFGAFSVSYPIIIDYPLLTSITGLIRIAGQFGHNLTLLVTFTYINVSFLIPPSEPTHKQKPEHPNCHQSIRTRYNNLALIPQHGPLVITPCLTEFTNEYHLNHLLSGISSVSFFLLPWHDFGMESNSSVFLKSVFPEALCLSHENTEVVISHSRLLCCHLFCHYLLSHSSLYFYSKHQQHTVSNHSINSQPPVIPLKEFYGIQLCIWIHRLNVRTNIFSMFCSKLVFLSLSFLSCMVIHMTDLDYMCFQGFLFLANLDDTCNSL